MVYLGWERPGKAEQRPLTCREGWAREGGNRETLDPAGSKWKIPNQNGWFGGHRITPILGSLNLGDFTSENGDSSIEHRDFIGIWCWALGDKKTWGMSANGDFSTKNRDNPQGLGVQKPNCQFAYPFNKTGTIYYPVGREFTWLQMAGQGLSGYMVL